MQRQTVSPDRRATLAQFSDEQQREVNGILSTNGFWFHNPSNSKHARAHLNNIISCSGAVHPHTGWADL